MKTTHRFETGWMRYGNCRNKLELFYPEDENYDEAWGICHKCPFRSRCLDYALYHRESQGFWGGRDPDERRKIRLKYKRSFPALLEKMSPAIEEMTSEYMFAQDVLNAKSKMQALLKVS